MNLSTLCKNRIKNFEVNEINMDVITRKAKAKKSKNNTKVKKLKNHENLKKN